MVYNGYRLYRRHSFHDLRESRQLQHLSGGLSRYRLSQLCDVTRVITQDNSLHSSRPSPFLNYHGPSLRRCISQNLFAPTVIRRPKLRTNGDDFDLHSIFKLSDVPKTPLSFRSEFAPSLKTIETTSDVKIYLETHFNNILMNPNIRSTRRRAMECRLQESVSTLCEKSYYREVWRRKESQYLRDIRTNKVTIADFEIIKVIGKGAFGCVQLAKMKERVAVQANYLYQLKLDHDYNDIGIVSQLRQFNQPTQLRELDTSDTKQVFALKVIPKAEHLKNGQEGHLRAERDFLVASEGSRWVVPLIASFQDDDNLYQSCHVFSIWGNILTY